MNTCTNIAAESRMMTTRKTGRHTSPFIAAMRGLGLDSITNQGLKCWLNVTKAKAGR